MKDENPPQFVLGYRLVTHPNGARQIIVDYNWGCTVGGVEEGEEHDRAIEFVAGHVSVQHSRDRLGALFAAYSAQRPRIPLDNRSIAVADRIEIAVNASGQYGAFVNLSVHVGWETIAVVLLLPCMRC